MLGPSDSEKWSSLEYRVERLEDDMADVKATLNSIEAKLGGVAEAVAEIKGRVGGLEMRLSAMPTTIQLVVLLITTWSAGAAIVFALPKIFT
jgi:archaellum component FlaC